MTAEEMFKNIGYNRKKEYSNDLYSFTEYRRVLDLTVDTIKIINETGEISFESRPKYMMPHECHGYSSINLDFEELAAINKQLQELSDKGILDKSYCKRKREWLKKLKEKFEK